MESRSTIKTTIIIGIFQGTLESRADVSGSKDLLSNLVRWVKRRKECTQY